ncbi:hypothetical protein FACS1894145_5770 [Bacteroidia bacterium]|nr:hypothetical protein FACS1894145_5770 [Bacteroidia bacterium]
MNKKASILYMPDSTYKEVEPKNKKYFILKELQSFVDGYIECIYLEDNMTIVVNEEGKLNKLPVNNMATKIAIENGYDDVIVGPALVCQSKLIK